MLAPYTKQYIRFSRIEKAEQTLIYAILLENQGGQEIALSEPTLVRVILKTVPQAAALPVGNTASPFFEQLVTSPFVQSFIAESSIPHFSYARPPTL